MGCCLSKNQDFNNTPPPHFSVSTHHPLKPPLPPVFEEESVKEVLSETPKPKPISEDENPTIASSVVPSVSKIKEEEKKIEQVEKILETTSKEKKRDGEDRTPTPTYASSAFPKERRVEKNGGFEEFSEVSEICSLSESISTTTVTEIRDDEDGEVQQRVYRSPAKSVRKRPIPGDFVARHERGSKSPARRFSNNPSPARRNDSVSETARRRSMAENNRVRRDSGERSGRRSRSPATRVNSGTARQGVGRSPSRKAPRSPARIPAVAPSDNGRSKGAEEDKSTNESIENPHVSLECFIFV